MTDGVRFFSSGPLPAVAILLIIAIIILLIPLLVLGVVGSAFTRLGLSWVAALALVLLMLAGSLINVPVYHMQRDVIRATPLPANDFGGMDSQSPAWEMVVSINLGGAILPVCFAVYLGYQALQVSAAPLLLRVFFAIAVVAVITALSTRDSAGGLRVPLFIPALTALLAGLLVTGGTGLSAAVIAFAGGVGGTLLGGNVLQLPRMRDLGFSEASIGGAGTFGAVFLCCVLPALIA